MALASAPACRHSRIRVVNEHEPLLLDFAALFARLAPDHAPYRHDDMAARTVNLAPGEISVLVLGADASASSRHERGQN